MPEVVSWEENVRETDLRESILNWYEFRRDASLLEICTANTDLTDLFRRRVRSVITLPLAEALTKAELIPDTDSGEGDLSPEGRYDYIVCLEILEKETEPVSSAH